MTRCVILRVLTGLAVFLSPILLAMLVAQSFTHPSWYYLTARTSYKDGLNLAFASLKWMNFFTNPLKDHNITYIDVEFDGPYGSTLRGWYVPAPSYMNSTRGIVLVHGAGMDRREFLRQTPILHRAGYHLLLFDCREHGISSGSLRGYTFGLREHSDIIYAVRYFRNMLPLSKLAVVGTSQGATSTILAASKEDQIDAVVLENPFASFDELLTDVIEGVLNAKPNWTEEEQGLTNYFVTLGSYIPTWYRSLLKYITMMKVVWLTNEGNYINAADVIGSLHQPLFLIHGTADSLIPMKHSQKLYKLAHDPKQLWIAEGCEHTAIFNKYPQEYAKKVTSFLSEYM